MTERRWVAYFESGGIGKIPVKRRYLRLPGAPIYRGMYKQRRLRGYSHAEWTDDRERAFRFRSPSAAKKSKWTFAPARIDKILFEKVEENDG